MTRQTLSKIAFSFLMVASLSACGGGGKKSESKPASSTTTTTSSSSSSSSSSTMSSNTSKTYKEAKPTKIEKAAKMEGKALNKFFAKDADGHKVVFTTEKVGTSQAKLNKDGKEVATFTITDLMGEQAKIDAYKKSTGKVGAYPMLAKGSKGTAILVGNRYQIQVRAKDAKFDEAARKKWLEKFDLKGLAMLK